MSPHSKIHGFLLANAFLLLISWPIMAFGDVEPPKSVKSAKEDEIRLLPGLEFTPKFKHYSGYLDVGEKRFFHYWFVTSQNNPVTDPLVFWFNGGPGCSSLDGLLKGMGPYVANRDGRTLRANPYAWNKHASVVYIESPAGVGYSYATDGNIGTNDDQTAELNYVAFKRFFERHPAYRENRNPVIMSGESYAGVYVPALTALIVEGQKDFPVNLKGMLIGNGYMNVKLNYDTMVKFAYSHGMVDEQLWKGIGEECCAGNIEKCDLFALKDDCKERVDRIYQFVWNGKDASGNSMPVRLNRYDLNRDCILDPESPKVHCMDRGLSRGLKSAASVVLEAVKSVKKALRHKKVLATSESESLNGGSKSTDAFGVAKEGKKLDPPMLACMDDSDAIAYMNQPKVRAALHIPKHLGKWEMCSSRRNDEEFYKMQEKYEDMSPIVQQILKANVATLFYYGDTDMVCNLMMGQKFTDSLGYELTSSKKLWPFNGQVGGFETVYGHDELLTFMTVKGAGHMVLEWAAAEAEEVFRKFVRKIQKK